MKITIIAGARPNFIKIAPIIKAIENQQSEGKTISYRLVHTGQHYDKNLSDTFFEELNIPHPNANLEVKSGSQAEQTGAIMIAFEKELLQNPCDLVLVVGDVNSTMACYWLKCTVTNPNIICFVFFVFRFCKKTKETFFFYDFLFF